MITELEKVKTGLQPPVQKTKLIEFMSYASNIPPMFKSMAYIAINKLKQPELDNIGSIALEVISMIENNQDDELSDFLNSQNIPPQIAQIIIANGKNYIKV